VKKTVTWIFCSQSVA